MSTMYELTADWLRLMDFIEDPEIDQDMLMEAWLDLDDDLETKAENYAKVMVEKKAMVEAIKAEIDRLSIKKRTIENNLERLRLAVKGMMETTGKTKFKTPLFSFAIQKNPPSLKILNEEKIPMDYLIPQPPKVDAAAVKAYLKSLPEDELCEWAELIQGESLRIR